MKPQLPAAQASVFLLQPPHVINHVKWQKAQHCQDCEGDLMELKMGCFVVMQSILFHLRRLACLPARSLARSLACLLAFAMPPNSEFFFWCQVATESVKAVSILSKDPDGSNTAEKFWLVLVVMRMSPWIWFAPSALHSWPSEQHSSALLCRAVYWPQHSSLETWGENRFHFPLLRLIHWFQGGKSSKMHVQRELNLFCAVCCVRLRVLDLSSEHSQLPCLQARVQHET